MVLVSLLIATRRTSMQDKRPPAEAGGLFWFVRRRRDRWTRSPSTCRPCRRRGRRPGPRLGLGHLDHQRFGGEQQSRRSKPRSAELCGSTLVGSMTPAFTRFSKMPVSSVVAEVRILGLEHLGHDHCALFAGIGDDLAQRLFERAANDLRADLLVAFERLDQGV